jgi:septum site-determining protein MinC
MSKNQARKPLEIKISTVVAVAALIGDTDYDKLSSALAHLTAGTPDYFEDEFTLLDFAPASPMPDPGQIDWLRLIALFKSHRLNPVAVRLRLRRRQRQSMSARWWWTHPCAADSAFMRAAAT